MKTLPVGAESFHADRQTDRHDEANSLSSKFCERASFFIFIGFFLFSLVFYFHFYTVHVVELHIYYTNHCTYIKFIIFFTY